MPRGIVTKSKIETFPKIVVKLGGILLEVFTIDELSEIIQGADNAKVNKTVEQYEALTIHVDAAVVEAYSVAKEVTSSLVDEVFNTSIKVTWSWEVVGED